jgi:hypothetical protein
MLILFFAVTGKMWAGTNSALASAPRWQLGVSSAPTYLPPGGKGQIAVAATNLGDAAANGSGAPVTITDHLPPGVSATSILPFPFTYAGYLEYSGELACSLPSSSLVSCTWSGLPPLPPYETLEVRVAVNVAADARSGEESEATITGGEAPSASIRQPLIVDGAPTPFGVKSFAFLPENEDGSPDTQAGSHPFQLTSTITFNQALESNSHWPGEELPTTPALTKDLNIHLPAGFVGDPTPFPQCSALQFGTIKPGDIDLCPPDTALGVASVTLEEPHNQGMATIAVPLFNLTPAKGEPARFGFEALGVPVILDTAVRAGGDYGVTVSVKDISEAGGVLSSRVTFWGVPGDPRHDISRGWSCLDYFAGGSCTEPDESQPPPFLALPTSCTGSLKSPVEEVDSWAEPGKFLAPVESTTEESLSGCNRLAFNPSIEVAPDGPAASTPTGLTVDVHVPQDTTLTSTGLAESDVRSTTVTLPAGLQVNPAAAGGLEACTEADIGFESYDDATGQAFFHEESEPERQGLVSHQECPAGSKLGTVKIRTPLLSEPLEGSVYQAAQGANPFGSLLALYVVAEDKEAGVRVRLAGKVEPNLNTGQLVSTFDQTPELPFEEFDLTFFGGGKAPLASASCGAYRTETSIEPWSGGVAASPFSEFDVTTGPDGTPCSSLGSFSPAFLSGTANNDAGVFSPLTLTLSRKNGEQTLSTVAMTMPPGLLGMLSKVALCGEAQANGGSCPASSQIGHVTVQAGVGNEPITLPEAGRQEDPVYLSGPYEGAPFGLAIVVHPEAGPFNLEEDGRPVIVRAKIEINSTTAQVSIASNPMPTMLRGIPLDVRTVNVTIDREGFMFTPTNCEPLAIDGTIDSAEGAVANVSSRYEAANCATLPFKPKLSASTVGKASKAGGASLDVKVTAKGGPQPGGGEANIKSVKVDLPKQLPSRLTTLQKACTARVFEANPASCPKESDAGSATASTPVLAHPLVGPAYLVSHGRAAFPDLEIVLQGEGITLILDGSTDIKKGITSSTFRSVPDAPISSFELKLPTGKYSILGTNLPQSAHYSLCKRTLAMPTAFVGQNGAEIHESTPISVSGCPKGKKAKKGKTKRGKKSAQAKKNKR